MPQHRADAFRLWLADGRYVIAAGRGDVSESFFPVTWTPPAAGAAATGGPPQDAIGRALTGHASEAVVQLMRAGLIDDSQLMRAGPIDCQAGARAAASPAGQGVEPAAARGATIVPAWRGEGAAAGMIAAWRARTAVGDSGGGGEADASSASVAAVAAKALPFMGEPRVASADEKQKRATISRPEMRGEAAPGHDEV